MDRSELFDMFHSLLEANRHNLSVEDYKGLLLDLRQECEDRLEPILEGEEDAEISEMQLSNAQAIEDQGDSIEESDERT